MPRGPPVARAVPPEGPCAGGGADPVGTAAAVGGVCGGVRADGFRRECAMMDSGPVAAGTRGV